MASTQSSIVVAETGKPAIKTTRPIPTPKENEVVVKVTSAGINPHDHKIRDWGLFNFPLPISLCADVAGIVTAVGTKVDKYSIGDHVFGYPDFRVEAQGSQQYAILETDCMARVPSNISDDQAATFPVNLFAPVVALFDPRQFGFPYPNSPEAKDFDGAAQTLVVIGGGSSCGKFAVQLAKLAGIGKIVVTASPSNAEELKSYGATHVVDRHGSDVEVEARVREIVGNDLIYVFDPINVEHSLAVALLSSEKKGKIVTLLVPKVPESTSDDKKDYSIAQVVGLPHWHRGISIQIFEALPSWIESGKLKPLGFQIVEGGFNVDGFNKVLDDHRDGKNPGKWHFHPNDA